MKRMVLILLILCLSCSRAWAYDWTQDANCVAAWLMDSDEDPLTDSSTNTNSAALKAAGEPNFDTASPPAAYSTGYYDFDGSDDYASASYDASLDFAGAGKSFSLVAWIYLEVDQSGGIVQRWRQNTSTSQQWEMIRGGTNDNIVFAIYDGGYQVASSAANSATTGSWIHVASTANSGTMTVYINGSTSGTTDTYGTISDDANNASCDIGVSNYGDAGAVYFNGDLDEIAVFSDALDSTDINDIMDNGLVQAAAGRTRRFF